MHTVNNSMLAMYAIMSKAIPVPPVAADPFFASTHRVVGKQSCAAIVRWRRDVCDFWKGFQYEPRDSEKGKSVA